MHEVPGECPRRAGRTRILIVLGLLLLAHTALGAEAAGSGCVFPSGRGAFHLDLEIRTRAELWHNYTVKGPANGTDDQALLLRTRILGQYWHPRGYRLVLELQDSRYAGSRLAPGDFPRTCPFEDQLDVHQGFAELRLAPRDILILKVGRQVISYADRRIFGPGNWGNVGRYWWDATKLSFLTGAWRTDFLWGQRVIREPGRLDTDHYPFHLLGAYSMLHRPWGQLHLFLLERRSHRTAPGETGTGRTRVRTAGAWLHLHPGAWWILEGTLALQRGERGGDEVRAWGGHILLRRRLPGRSSPYLGAELAIGSGDRDPLDGIAGTFDGVFGSVSGAYGRMNLFCWKNLRDLVLTVGFRPFRETAVWLDLHHFELDSASDAWYWCSGKPLLRDPRGLHGRQLGHEIDLLLKTRLNRHWTLFAGAGFFRRGSFLDQDPRVARHLAWGFVQLAWSI